MASGRPDGAHAVPSKRNLGRAGGAASEYLGIARQTPVAVVRKGIYRLLEGFRTMPQSLTFAEKHYTIQELAELWGLSAVSVWRLVKVEPDVVKMKKGPKGVKTTYTVPESVAKRIHTRLTA